MNLSLPEIAGLPLAAALFDGDELLASTPEWPGAGPGCLSYAVRRTRLVVAGEPPHPACAELVDRLLGELDGVATAVAHVQSLRIRMLADSLRVLAGRALSSPGRSADVLEHACAGIASRTALRVGVDGCADFAVTAPPVAALVLVQLAANAERHEGAEAVALSAASSVFTVSWQARARPGGGVSTARRRGDRAGWGMGFARIGADAIGAAVYPPVGAPGQREAVLETGRRHLALPLARVESGTIRKSTRTWDEETGLSPGTALPAGSRAQRCLAAAAAARGEIAAVDGWTARGPTPAGTWLAIPPDGAPDRARDLLDGMVHERALWDRVPEPGRSRIAALAAILGSALGVALPRVPGATWNHRAAEAAVAFGLTVPPPCFEGLGAVDPRVALFLAAELDGRLEAGGDTLELSIGPAHRDHPLARLLSGGRAAAALRLS